MAKAATKTRVTKKHVQEHRAKASRDTSPKWDGCESWDADTFHKHFRNAMDYYRLESDIKTYKPIVIKWMTDVGCTKDDIASLKKVKDNRISTTMGAIAHCLTRGMTPQRADFNNGKDTAAWLRNAIVEAINAGKDDTDPDEVKAAEEVKPAVYTPSIQERVREAALNMTVEIEDALESFYADMDAFNPKEFKIISVLRGKGAKAAHARIIKDFYAFSLAELEELASGKGCEQLKEGYSHMARKHVKKLIEFYQEVSSACDMLAQEAKLTKKPRAKKPTDKAKVVSKLKFRKNDESLKLVSINPIDIIGAKELWVFNAKTRKLGKYVAGEFSELGVKGTTITGFDEHKSVQKTLRKPAEQLKAFKDAGKVALRKFLDDINAVDTALNGRTNEETLLLKVQ